MPVKPLWVQADAPGFPLPWLGRERNCCCSCYSGGRSHDACGSHGSSLGRHAGTALRMRTSGEYRVRDAALRARQALEPRACRGFLLARPLTGLAWLLAGCAGAKGSDSERSEEADPIQLSKFTPALCEDCKFAVILRCGAASGCPLRVTSLWRNAGKALWIGEEWLSAGC